MSSHLRWALIHIATEELHSFFFDTRKEAEGYVKATCRGKLYRIVRVAVREVAKP